MCLSKTARDSLDDGTLPQDVIIAPSTQAAPQSVVISLNLDTLSDYKLLPLNRPPRLVVDLYSKAPQKKKRHGRRILNLPQRILHHSRRLSARYNVRSRLSFWMGTWWKGPRRDRPGRNGGETYYVEGESSLARFDH